MIEKLFEEGNISPRGSSRVATGINRSLILHASCGATVLQRKRKESRGAIINRRCYAKHHNSSHKDANLYFLVFVERTPGGNSTVAYFFLTPGFSYLPEALLFSSSKRKLSSQRHHYFNSPGDCGNTRRDSRDSYWEVGKNFVYNGQFFLSLELYRADHRGRGFIGTRMRE